MFEKIKILCDRLKIDYKKDLIITIVIFVCFIVIGIVLSFIYSMIIGIIIWVIGFVYIFLHYSNLKSSVKQLTNSKEIAFNGFYRCILQIHNACINTI